MRTLTLLAALFATASAMAADNVALGKSVSLFGNFGTLRSGSIFSPQPLAAASTLTDGVYVPEGTPWQRGTIWWDTQVAGAANNYVFVDLGGLFQIDSVRLQSDDNDEINLWSMDTAGTWQYLGYYGTSNQGAGMRTRGIASVGSLVSQGFALGGRGGDQYYSIAEFQAYGQPVPEPATLAALGAGALVMLRKRRQPR